jgi:hypothetical protein
VRSKGINTKPPTISCHSNIIIALITSKKTQSNKVTGNVSITKIGLIKILSNPKQETISAVVKPLHEPRHEICN